MEPGCDVGCWMVLEPDGDVGSWMVLELVGGGRCGRLHELFLDDRMEMKLEPGDDVENWTVGDGRSWPKMEPELGDDKSLQRKTEPH